MGSSLRNKLVLSYILIIVSMLVIAGVSLIVLLRNYQVQIAKTRLGEQALILSANYNSVINQSLKDALEDQSAAIAGTYNSYSTTLLNGKERIPIPQVARDVSNSVLDALYAEVDRRAGTINARVLLIGRDGTILYDSNDGGDSLRGQHISQFMDKKDAAFIQAPRNYTEGRYVASDKVAYIYGGAALNPSQAQINAVFLNSNTNAQQRFPKLKSEAQAKLLLDHLRVLLPRYVVVLRPQSEVESVQELFRPLLFSGLVALLVSLIMAVLLSRSIAKPVREITRASEAMAKGNFEQEIHVQGKDEIARLAKSFNTMAVEVAESHQTLRDFVANVSHELKTPITSIQGFSQALLDGTITDDEMRHRAAGIINEESMRMSRLVGQLLDLARMESGQIQLAHMPVDVANLLHLCRDKFALRAGQKQVKIKLRIELSKPAVLPAPRSLLPRLRPIVAGIGSTNGDLPALPESSPPGININGESDWIIQGDPDRLEQVFTNLLDNALKYTASNSTITITARRQENGWIEVSTGDQGPGIPTADLPRIFERFYRVDKSRAKAQEGSGLGLAITREIILAHGGTITAESRLGAGTTFIIHLPPGQG